ncbi:cell division protein FtsQ/DivIB [Phytoactinopolyspora limicola]|uniref:cell division protein FtsQ/DivIB n=1 Tax=Phytoactinopolyspora limicola TaxID=2715536 RepID=UPI00140AA44D|nr:FtsQ-type POTRA domain-containing protein [Phytoactinopolyspora limicola]
MSGGTQSAGAQRFTARVRRRRTRKVLHIAVAAVAVAGLGVAAWLVGWSSALAVQDVRVVGVDNDLAADVADIAEVPIGVPLARVDAGEIASRVRELPEVGDVKIRRSWPRTLTIDVAPRVPLAAVPDGSRWWSVDETGVLFARSSDPPDGVPVMSAPTGESATLARVMGVEVLTGLPANVDELVDRIEVESAADVRLILDDGIVVRWGTSERGDDKAAALLALMDTVEEPPSAYDVSAPDKPAIVP